MPESNETITRNIRLELWDLIDAFPFYVTLLDKHHHILMANNAVLSQLGMYPRDIVGKYCPAVIHGLDRPIEACPLEEAVETNEAVERELFDQKSGRWIKSSIFPTNGSSADGSRIYFHMVTDITDRKLALDELKSSRAQLRELSQHLESVREEEKTRLAGEIHDELGQLLTGLKMDVAWLARKLPAGAGALLEKTGAMSAELDGAIDTVKRISSELRPWILDYLGLAPAIEWQVRELEKRSGINIEFKSLPAEMRLDQGLATVIFRICQEALTNVVRHAHASQVKITLRKAPGRVTLKIQDNGSGIEAGRIDDPKAFGLVSMKERALGLGGDVAISSRPGQGTLVTVTMPLAGGSE